MSDDVRLEDAEELATHEPRAASWGATWTVIGIALIAMIVAAAVTSGRPVSDSSGLTDPDIAASATPTTFSYSGVTPSSLQYSQGATVTDTVGTWTMSGTDDQEYSAGVTLAVAPLVKASQASTTQLARAVESCSVDPDTDAVIPVHLEEDNTTSSFPSILGFTLNSASTIDSLSNSNITLAGDVVFGSGPECIEPNSGSTLKVFGVQWTDPLVAGASASDDFYIVVHNYFSPAHPSGDSTGLAQLTLAPVITFGDTNSGSIARFVTNVSVESSGDTPFTIAGATP